MGALRQNNADFILWHNGRDANLKNLGSFPLINCHMCLLICLCHCYEDTNITMGIKITLPDGPALKNELGINFHDYRFACIHT